MGITDRTSESAEAKRTSANEEMSLTVVRILTLSSHLFID